MNAATEQISPDELKRGDVLCDEKGEPFAIVRDCTWVDHKQTVYVPAEDYDTTGYPEHSVLEFTAGKAARVQLKSV